jgi:hypothetical protein
MSRPDAATLNAALAEDLRQLTEKYRLMLPETFVGASVCVADYGAGTLAAALSMAVALLRTVLDNETNPQVYSLVNRAQRLVHTAVDLKTGQLLATNSLH